MWVPVCSPQMMTPAAPAQEIRVAGLLVGGVDGHLRGARLLQIEDARVVYHLGVPVLFFTSSKDSGRAGSLSRPARNQSSRTANCAVGSGGGPRLLPRNLGRSF